MAPLLEIRDLKIEFETEEGVITAIDGVDLHVAEGETLGLVGESGCGAPSTTRSRPTPCARGSNGILIRSTSWI